MLVFSGSLFAELHMCSCKICRVKIDVVLMQVADLNTPDCESYAGFTQLADGTISDYKSHLTNRFKHTRL